MVSTLFFRFRHWIATNALRWYENIMRFTFVSDFFFRSFNLCLRPVDQWIFSCIRIIEMKNSFRIINCWKWWIAHHSMRKFVPPQFSPLLMQFHDDSFSQEYRLSPAERHVFQRIWAEDYREKCRMHHILFYAIDIFDCMYIWVFRNVYIRCNQSYGGSLWSIRIDYDSNRLLVVCVAQICFACHHRWSPILDRPKWVN